MNVVYGPNESGKSSWHAAIYASICGMRRARGRASRDDQDFADRHRPWNGRTWRVSAIIDLDDGRTLELDQRLGRGGLSTATDRHTNKQMTSAVEREGAVDVSTLLGLSRETAVATIFVRQADVLRVLADASSLQEYLERAAATNAIDTTADEALARIAAYKRERVGLLRVGSRGPLATATANLDDARAALDDAENRYENYQALLERQRDAERAVGESERALRHVLLHETERRRLEEWSEIRTAERRLEHANLLQRQIAAGPPDGEPGRDVTANVTRALASFEARPPLPPPLEGPTITEIEAELAALPDVPDGDLEPAEEVVALREAWQREGQRLAAHDNNQPESSEADDAPQQDGATAGEIEAELAALPDVPDGDLEPAEEVIALREAWQREGQRLAAHDNNQPESSEADDAPQQDGATAGEIEAELAALPDVPDGDLEPAEEVIALREAWQREGQRLAAHDSTGSVHVEVDRPPLPPAELRRLADELEAPLPVVDPSLRDEVNDRRAAQAEPIEPQRAVPSKSLATDEVTHRPRLRIAVIGGVVLAILGLVLLAAGQPLPGAAAVVLGCALTGIAFSSSRRAVSTVSGASAPGPSTLVADVELQRLEARLLLEEEAVAQAARRREGAVARLDALNLSLVPAELRQLANTHDAATFDRERAAEWERRRDDLEAAVAVAAQRLRATLAARGTEVADQDDLDEGFQRYVQACRERAQQASRAARRVDLEARLRERRAADSTRAAAVERGVEWERRRGDLEAAVAVAAQRLRATLAARGTEVADQDDLDEGFQRYVQACRERAQQASRAARRVDLEARLRERRAADSTRAAAVERGVEWERRRGDLEAAVAVAVKQLRATLVARGTEVADQDDLDEGFQRYVQACRERAQQASRAARRVDLEARLRERRAAGAARKNDVAARADTERQLVAAAAEAQCSDSADPEQLATILRNWLVTQDGLDKARQQKAQHVTRLDQLLDGRSIDELEAEIAERIARAGHRPDDNTVALEDRSAQAEALEDRVRVARDHAAELVGQLEVAASHLLDVSAAIEAEARADAEVRRVERLSDDLDRATNVLVAAQRKVHADIAPVLNSTLQPWVPRITLGRYDDIRVNPATLELEARESGGAFRPATLLSQGTTEQLFLLLRLALAQHLATTGESAPIILDDVTVQSDTQRTVGILDLLHELSVDRQVILFSQEDEVLSWADQHLAPPNDRLVRLSRRGP